MTVRALALARRTLVPVLVGVVVAGSVSLFSQEPPARVAIPQPLAEAERTERRSAQELRHLEHQFLRLPDETRMFDEAARSAWAYVARHYQPATGLINSTSGYPYTTVWDIGSAIAALYCGHELKFLDDGEYDKRMRRLLQTLQTVGIVDGAAFNKVYSTQTGAMIGRDQRPSARGYGWSTTDIGRLLVWLKILAATQPVYANEAAAIVHRLDFKRLVKDGYVWGGDFDAAWKPRVYQEGQLGYEQYSASGFAAWGATPAKAVRLTENALPLTVMGRALFADVRGRDRVTSDPFILMGLEVGWDAGMEQIGRAHV